MTLKLQPSTISDAIYLIDDAQTDHVTGNPLAIAQISKSVDGVIEIKVIDDIRVFRGNRELVWYT